MLPDDFPQWPDGLPISIDSLFTIMAERSYNPTIVTDRHYRILWANASFTRVTGYTLAEARGQSPAHFLRYAGTDPAIGKLIAEAIAEGRSFHTTLANLRKDGSCYWINLDGQPMRNEQGELVAYVIIGVDVSAEVEHEAALRLNENLLNTTQRIAHVGSWEYDPQTNLTHWSAETYRIYGLPVSDSPPSTATVLASYLEAHRPLVAAAFNDCLEAGAPFDIEVQLRQPGGRELWVRSIGHAERQQDRIVRVAGALQNIDERKRAELEVVRLADRMSLAAHSAGIGIWEYDCEKEVLSWDDTMLRLYGLDRESFNGEFSAWESSVHPEDRIQAKDILARAVAELGELEIEFRIIKPDGEIRHLKGTVRIDHDSRKALRAYGVNYDITAERAGEQELRDSRQHLLRLNTNLQSAIEVAQRLARDAETANQAKSAFLATMSHEIRTPLNGIIGMTHILADTPLNADQRDYLNTLKLSGESLLALINDTLDYSKIEAGRVELASAPFNLITCVLDAINLVEGSARQKNLPITRVIAADLPRLVEGDAARLRQILVNLLGNAVKFTERGGIHLEVRTRSISADEVAFTLSVRDTGIGIPADKLTRLFEHFFQVDATHTRSYGGTGLGLAISRRLAELMGGSIQVESEHGAGSTFSVHLQLPIVIEDALLNLPACHQRLASRRALVIGEPPRDTRIETAARLAGLLVTPTQDVDTAFALIAGGAPFDVAIAASRLPQIDSLDFALRLQTAGLGPVPLLPLERFGELDNVTTPRFHQLLASLVAPYPPVAPAAPAAPQAVTFATAHPLSILMVEDNLVNQRVTQLILNRLGYHAEIANHGGEALAALEKRAFDVILMDVQMPVMDGLEATRRIRAQPAHRPRPWIITITAGAFEEDRHNAFAAGMDDFLNKPLRTPLLQDALVRAWHALQTLPPPPTHPPGQPSPNQFVT